MPNDYIVKRETRAHHCSSTSTNVMNQGAAKMLVEEIKES
jgi:hypothetical protein